MILAPEEFHQRPEVEEEERERVGGQSWRVWGETSIMQKTFLEPLKASGVYVCRSGAAEKEERETQKQGKREKKRQMRDEKRLESH